MTIQLTTTTTAELTPEFPLYLQTEDGVTQFYFKSETDGISVLDLKGFSIIQTTSLDIILKVYSECNQRLIPSTRFKFAQVMAAASTKFDEIISSELMETEIEYPLNAVL